MRIVATFRHSPTVDTETALERLQEIMSNHFLVAIPDPKEEVDVFTRMVADMTEGDRREFESTWRVLARDPQRGTIASISVLASEHLTLRLRNVTLQKLVPAGHALIEEIMGTHGPQRRPRRAVRAERSSDPDRSDGLFRLIRCEVREKSGGDGFLFAAWKGGERRFLRFLFTQRRASFIVALLFFGLSLEVVLSFAPQVSEWVQLGLRLGAPMLVSSLVLLLERRAQWRDQVDPRLIWSPYEDQSYSVDPFRMKDISP